jgi:Na+-driven multidrug efflux pump
MGDNAIAAHQIAFRLWVLLAFALDAIAIAGQAITGRYLGAGDAAGARAATRRMTGWGVVYGLVFGALLLAVRPFLPDMFAVTPAVTRLLLAVLLIVALQQPVAGVVFVLDGVLIGAGDQNYLAVAGLAAAAVFAVAALVVHVTGGGLVALWLAYSLWLVARFVTLTLRARGTAWLVTGPVRSGAGQGLRAMPPCAETISAGGSSSGSARHVCTYTTPGGTSCRPSKKRHTCAWLRSVCGVATRSL